MNQKQTILTLLLLTATTLWAAVTPSANLPTYYSSINGKSGSTLRESLTSLVFTKHTTTLSYDWTFDGIDIVNGEVLDIYSTCVWTPTTDQCGGYSGVCDCYNREHVVPQSLFSEKTPQVGDRHHLFLTDGKVNGVRSNNPFGETNSTTGFSGITDGSKALGKFGSSSNGYSGNVYEPDDQYKGDIARAIFYMCIRYATTSQCPNGYPVTSWSSNAMFSGSLNTNYGLSSTAVEIFLKWHHADPVSAREQARNEGVENKQGNRNPFIDYPDLVDYLWGSYKTYSVNLSTMKTSYEGGGGGGETTYTDFLTDCAPAVTHNITYIDNLQQTDGYYPQKVVVVNEGTKFTFPNLGDKTVDEQQKIKGTCEQQHYHFMGWIIAEKKSQLIDDNIYAPGAMSPTVTSDATYYAVWAKELQ